MHEISRWRLWIELAVRSWRERRSETGGVSDETAMIGLMLGVAVAVAAIVLAAVTGAAGRLDFGF